MQVAYLDCFSGVSGDMLLGALLDAGLPESCLRETLTALSVPENMVHIERQVIHGFATTRVRIHDDGHGHADHHHGHQHRHLHDIASLLEKASLDSAVRERALAVFTRLAGAEAAVHGVDIDQIHFHEVGALDAIADIVGTVVGFAHLGVERLVTSPLPMPSGWVQCAHGEIPLPGPAVCRLLGGVPVYGISLEQELVTPTGAALVRELADAFGPMPPMIMERCGYGAGSMERADGRPNLLRLILGVSTEVAEAQVVEVLEAHLDDWNPEFWPLCCERIMEAGALDACLVPMQMKKGRPGFLLRVLAEPSRKQELATLLFTETSTAGIRSRREERMTLARESILVTTPWGTLRAKKIFAPDGARIVPEYEACCALAKKEGLPLQEIYAAVLARTD